jgi:hypothetical protein
MVLDVTFIFFCNQYGLLPDCRVPVDCIGRQVDMVFPLDTDQEVDSVQRISPTLEKIIIR